MKHVKSIRSYIATVIFSMCFLACGTGVNSDSDVNNYRTVPVTSVETARRIVIEKFTETEEVLLMPDSLNDSVGINMAIIGVEILSKGYLPSGLEKKDGYTIYKYKRHIPVTQTTAEAPVPFFDYDAIDYYVIAADKTAKGGISKNTTAPKSGSIYEGVLYGNIPQAISDTSFLVQLEKTGFVKSSVDTSKFDTLDELFAPKEVNDSVAYACKPVYRDILVFRKNGRIAGIAKVCFSCKKHLIVGAKGNTDNFGMNGDYERLQRLLHP